MKCHSALQPRQSRLEHIHLNLGGKSKISRSPLRPGSPRRGGCHRVRKPASRINSPKVLAIASCRAVLHSPLRALGSNLALFADPQLRFTKCTPCWSTGGWRKDPRAQVVMPLRRGWGRLGRCSQYCAECAIVIATVNLVRFHSVYNVQTT